MWLFALLGAAVLPAAAQLGGPKVNISHPDATIVGSSVDGIDSFMGIPYAQSPAGKNRLKPPRQLQGNIGRVQATGKPILCTQFTTGTTKRAFGEHEDSARGVLDGEGEDCLILNVQRPASAKKGSKLPVLVWIHGGGFAASGARDYDGTKMIQTSIANKQPVIYVALNYRLAGFGFMPGKEIQKDGAGNLGVLDQRLALEWVHDNIEAFGGDKSKVIIWGESAGSFCVFFQMLLYNGNNTYKGDPLFRGAIMNSGSLAAIDPIDAPNAQKIYNTVVRNAGCATAKDSRFKRAAASVPPPSGYTSLALSYIPRPDGTTLKASPEIELGRGSYAHVPFIVGDQEDEGTLFATSQKLNTTEQVIDYLSSIFYPSYPRSRVAELVSEYSQNPAAGSPFRTGDKNEVYPQYKRLAAILGDKTFTLGRRLFLSLAASKIPKWSYLSSYHHGEPTYGTAHGSDVAVCYGDEPGFPSRSCMAYYLSFVNTLDPNKQTGAGMRSWPQWKEGTKKLLHFQKTSNGILKDTFRNKAYEFIANPKKVLRQ